MNTGVSPRSDHRPTEPVGCGRAIIEALTSEATMTVQDLSDTVQRSPGTLRPILRKLIARGLVVAAAPVTSRKRAYRLPGT